MIGSLRGLLLERGTDTELLVEVAGLGYRVQVTPATAVTIGDEGTEVFLHVHHSVREDSETLFGFPTGDERRVFETLVSTHGVGPALALAILSVHGPNALRQVVGENDVAALCLVPGVGKKTAARLLVELSSKLGHSDMSINAVVGANSSGSGDGTPPGARSDVRIALEGLGYGTDEIRGVVADLPADGESAELLRLALRRLATGP